MPVHKGKGGKKRRKTKQFDNKRQIVYKTEGQAYGQIVKSHGTGIMDIICFTDNGPVDMKAHVRGNMKKKVWMNKGDIILVNYRDYQKDTCDIVLKYNSDEVRILSLNNHLPKSVEFEYNESTDINYENDVETEDADHQEVSTESDSDVSNIKPTNNKYGNRSLVQDRNFDMLDFDASTESDSDDEFTYL